MTRGHRFVLGLALAWVALSGCGGPATAPGTVRATGLVTFGGKPVAGANVIFYPAAGADAALASQAVTDNEGRFQLSTHVGGGKFQRGIEPGQYIVAVTKLDTAGITNTLAPPKSLLPRKYDSPKTSKLTADVTTKGENNFEFQLNSE